MELPLEIIVEIARFSNGISFINLGKTCSVYLPLLRDNSIWNCIMENDFSSHDFNFSLGLLNYRMLYDYFTHAKTYTIPPSRLLHRAYRIPRKTLSIMIKESAF